MTEPQPLLAAHDLKVERGGMEVLSIASFELHNGEIAALIGPNGAGKSTLMLTLAGLLPPAAGRILFRGEPIPAGSAATGYRRRIAMVFQEPLLFDTTVFENVAAGLKFRGLPREEVRTRVTEYLQRFQITHLANRSARKLSGGEAQRTSLARAFATEPELILLDEPFSALDPPTRQALTDDLEEVLRASGTAAVLATHDQAEALRLADRMAVMNDGTIIQTGTPTEVMNHPATEFVAAFVGMENIYYGTITQAAAGLMSVTVGSSELQLVGDGTTGEHVVMSIRPEHVVVGTATPDHPTSARNLFAGRVERIVPYGAFNKVYIECGFTLVATITNPSLLGLGLKTGSQVFASFKATSVHLIKTGK